MDQPYDKALEVGQGRAAVRFQVVPQGRDYLVLITGGQAHIGAVAACQGTDNGEHSDLPHGLVELPNHKEGPLAAEAAGAMARATGRTWAAVVGIHQDNATKAEIQEIVANVRLGLQELAEQWGLGWPAGREES